MLIWYGGSIHYRMSWYYIHEVWSCNISIMKIYVLYATKLLNTGSIQLCWGQSCIMIHFVAVCGARGQSCIMIRFVAVCGARGQSCIMKHFVAVCGARGQSCIMIRFVAVCGARGQSCIMIRFVAVCVARGQSCIMIRFVAVCVARGQSCIMIRFVAVCGTRGQSSTHGVVCLLHAGADRLCPSNRSNIDQHRWQDWPLCSLQGRPSPHCQRKCHVFCQLSPVSLPQ